MSAATTIDGPALPQVANHQYLAAGDFTSVGTQKSKHDPDDGRVSRPVGDDQGNHLACLPGDADVGNDLAVADPDALAVSGEYPAACIWLQRDRARCLGNTRDRDRYREPLGLWSSSRSFL